MITKEEILKSLMAERDKISPLKQVTDKWLEVRVDRISKKITEESTIEDLIEDSIEDIKDVQSNINSVMAEEAKKKPKVKEQAKEPEPVVTEEKAHYEFDEETKAVLAFAKEQRKSFLEKTKRDSIFNISKKSVSSENQQKVLREIVNDHNIDMSLDDSVISEECLRKFTKLIKLTIGEDSMPGSPEGGSASVKIDEFADLNK